MNAKTFFLIACCSCLSTHAMHRLLTSAKSARGLICQSQLNRQNFTSPSLRQLSNSNFLLLENLPKKVESLEQEIHSTKKSQSEEIKLLYEKIDSLKERIDCVGEEQLKTIKWVGEIMNKNKNHRKSLDLFPLAGALVFLGGVAYLNETDKRLEARRSTK